MKFIFLGKRHGSDLPWPNREKTKALHWVIWESMEGKSFHRDTHPRPSWRKTRVGLPERPLCHSTSIL